MKPIVLYDENYERVGETYPRRAKQLVRSGRALWLEDDHSLLMTSAKNQTLPTVKEEVFPMTTDTVFQNNGMAYEEATMSHAGEPGDLLMYLAKKNIAEKRGLLRHIIAYILMWPLLIALFTGLLNGISSYDSVFGHNVSIGELPYTIEGFSGSFSLYEWPYFIESSRGFSIIGPWSSGNLVGNAGEIIFSVNPSVQIFEQQAISRYSNLWHIVIGAMAAWGIWIIMRSIKIARRYLKSRIPKSPKPDPVALEYQRLKLMHAEN